MDIANLGLGMEVVEVQKGDAVLDKFVQTSARAETQTEKLTATQRAFGQTLSGALNPMRDLLSSINGNAAALVQLEREEQAAAAAARALAQAQASAAAEAKKLADEERKAAAAAAELASRVAALKTSTDPLGASIDRVNKELAEASTLYKQGAISAATFEQAQTVLTGRLNTLHLAHGKVGSSAKLTASEMVNLGRQFSDVGVTAAMGMSPLMILIQQGPQIADVFTVAAARGVTFSAALKEIAASAWAAVAPFAPWIAGIAAAAAALTGLVWWLKRQQDEMYAATGTMGAAEDAVYAYEEAVKVATGASDLLAASTRAAAEAAKQQALDVIKASQAIIIAKGAEIEAHQEAAAAGGFSEFGAVLGSQGSRTIRDEQKTLTEAFERLRKASADLLKSDEQRLHRGREQTAEYEKQARQVSMGAAQRIRDNAAIEVAALRASGATQQQIDDHLRWSEAAARAEESQAKLTRGTKEASKAARDHARDLKAGLKEILDLVDDLQREEQQRYDAQTKSTASFIAAMDKEIEEYGLTEDALRALNVQRQVEVANTPQEVAAIYERVEALRRLREAIVFMPPMSGFNAPAETGIPKELTDAKELGETMRLYETWATRLEKVSEAYDQVGQSAYNAFQAFANKDWAMGIRSLSRVISDFREMWGKGFEGKVGAVAGIADAAGQMIGGKAGGALSGAAAGAMAGTSIAPGIGTAIGAVIGGIVGLFGAGAAKRKAEAEKRQKEEERAQQILQQARQIEIESLKLTGQWLKAAALARKAEFDAIPIENRRAAQDLYNLKLAADFRQRFYSAEENAAENTRLVTAELVSLGLAADLTREQYKLLVNQGGELGAALLDLMGPFDEMTKAAEAAGEALKDIFAQAAIDTYVQETLAAREAAEQYRIELRTAGREGRGIDSASQRARGRAAERERIVAEAEAYRVLALETEAAIPGLLAAGDAMGAIGKLTKQYFADPANQSYIRDQTNFTNGSGFNVGGMNALMARVQANAAEGLLSTISEIAITVPDVVDVFESLLDTMERVNSPEFGGMGSGAGPVMGGGLYGALRRYSFYAATTDSMGRASTGYGLDVNDGNISLTREQQLRRIADAAAEIAREAQSQVRNVFGQITSSVQALDAAAKAANEPIAQLSGALGRFRSIAELMLDGFQYADASFQASATGQNARLVSQAASLAASVLATSEVRNTAAALGVSRESAMLVAGVRADDVTSFENAFLRLGDALGRGAITQAEYTSLFNRGLDVFEGLTDAATGAAAGLRALADELRLDKQLSPLSLSQRLGVAMGAYEANQNEGNARSLIGLLQDASGSEFEYRRAFAATLATFEPSGRLGSDDSGSTDELKALREQVKELQATMKSMADNTQKLADQGDRNQRYGLPTVPA